MYVFEQTDYYQNIPHYKHNKVKMLCYLNTWIIAKTPHNTNTIK